MSQDTRAETWGVLMYKKVLSDVDIERIEIVTFFVGFFKSFLIWYAFRCEFSNLLSAIYNDKLLITEKNIFTYINYISKGKKEKKIHFIITFQKLSFMK